MRVEQYSSILANNVRATVNRHLANYNNKSSAEITYVNIHPTRRLRCFQNIYAAVVETPKAKKSKSSKGKSSTKKQVR